MAKRKKQPAKIKFPPLDNDKTPPLAFSEFAAQVADVLSKRSGGKNIAKISKVEGQMDLKSFLTEK